MLRLPEHMLTDHLKNGVGARCRGRLVWLAERLRYESPPTGGTDPKEDSHGA